MEFNNACYEVLEILKYVKNEDLLKIPEEEIDVLKKNANYEYDFYYNPSKSLKEQSVSKLAKGIIAVYFSKYIASKEQKAKIIRKQQYDLENMKQSEDASLKSEMLNKTSSIETKENNQLIEYQGYKWYQKLFRKLFNKNKNEKIKEI